MGRSRGSSVIQASPSCARSVDSWVVTGSVFTGGKRVDELGCLGKGAVDAVCLVKIPGGVGGGDGDDRHSSCLPCGYSAGGVLDDNAVRGRRLQALRCQQKAAGVRLSDPDVG